MDYKVCVKCVMDTTDPRISFNDDGICNHCERISKLDLESKKVPLVPSYRSNRFSRYDCIIGLSGGVDSCYLLHWAVEQGLKPLAVHYDSGWNSELSQKNIERLVTLLNVDLVTEIADWQSMRKIQLAFLRAGVANCDIPQDHAFVSVLYKYAVKFRVFTILTGHNSATESILPTAWGYTSRDSVYLRSVLKSQGLASAKLKYPLTPSWKLLLYSKIIPFKYPLDQIVYEKNKAKEVLKENYQWVDYGGKHMESMFTSFFQSIYLPEKFNYDKRRAHLSSMIISGQISREDSIFELSKAPIDSNRRSESLDYIANKLEITRQELEKILLKGNNKSLFDFKYNKLIYFLRERKFHGE